MTPGPVRDGWSLELVVKQRKGGGGDGGLEASQGRSGPLGCLCLFTQLRGSLLIYEVIFGKLVP
jgi:hypothetical protein